MEYDLIIRNGTIVDGSGAARFKSDVAITDGKIAKLIAPGDRRQRPPRAKSTRGLIVAPGFIDMHSHSDWVIPIPEHATILKPFLVQGVTTFVGGNCGFSDRAGERRNATGCSTSRRRCCRSERSIGDGSEVSELGAHLKRRDRAEHGASGGPRQYPAVRDGPRRGRSLARTVAVRCARWWSVRWPMARSGSRPGSAIFLE